jgi:SOS response regulatory protein OraA/RecX
MGNTYTPAGQVTVPNTNYNKELTEWKKTKLFPFFLERGFSKEELNEAWKVSVFKK